MTEGARELKRAKAALRREVLARRDAMPAIERERAGEAIVRRALDASAARPRAVRAMAFWSFGSEVPTGPLIEGLIERGDAVALPRLVDGRLEARMFAPGDPVEETTFGAMEPASGETVPPERLDLVFVPGVAFDRAGFRVGYGGGYYDRFLARVAPGAMLIGLCFGVQLVDEVPAGAFDLPVAVVVTERETIVSGADEHRGDAARPPSST